ncbi:TolC family protein [Novosphingobium sp. KN65.2]|uniref:TolC family protein n=1 Tax=Novosphingobium sp. KN65.2 TaxID=1478134 RepID=UPI0005DD31F3|nr:TolC family protein [Novosphingobium sp. KN65.2]CDO38270.1 putative Agglutination protein [Novosphingobium sp. KN65.2]
MLYGRTIAAGIAVLLSGTASVALAQSAGPVSLRDAIVVAVNSNPEVAQAQYNTEAIQFERKQAQGLYAPRVDVEASAGWRHLENRTRRSLGIAGQELYPLSAEVRAEWVALDFGRRRGELLRQAARVDGASLRVVERSEYIALQVARQYLDILLQQRIVAASEDNVAFHRSLVNDLTTGVEQGSISIADQQQSEERLQAALVRQSEAEQDLTEAKIKLRRLTGLDIDNVSMPPELVEGLPGTLSEAVGLARTENPLVKEAAADVDAAGALADSVRGDGFPKIGVDLNGRAGEDIDGFRGSTKDVQARVFLRWNVFDGGINRANYQEMVRRASEARYRLYQVTREAEEDVQTAWTTLQTQGRIGEQLGNQSRVSDDLLLSYRSQFNVGRRSLLDVLDAQNTRYNVQVRLETARFSEMFARYQVLAATNRFLTTINVPAGAGAGMNERDRFHYGPPNPAETQYRTYP